MRSEAKELTAEDLEDFVGRYYSDELELWIEVRAEEGELVLHRRWAEPMALSPRPGATFGGSMPFATIEFQRASDGQITGLVAPNGRTKGVLFQRR